MVNEQERQSFIGAKLKFCSQTEQNTTEKFGLQVLPIEEGLVIFKEYLWGNKI